MGGYEGDDALQLLKDWSEAHGGKDPGNDLREAGVPIVVWSRAGTD